MKFSNHLIILSTIILGFWIDDFLNPLTIKLYLELNFGFLIFAYWVFAIPEKLNSSAALFYGLVSFSFIILKPKKILSSFWAFSLIFGVTEYI